MIRTQRTRLAELALRLPTRIPKGAILLGSLYLLNVAFAYAREAAIAFRFGASGDVDAFLVAASLPQLLVTNATSITVATVLPLYISLRETGNALEASRLLESWFRLVVRTTVVACIALGVLAHPLVSLLGPGLPEASRERSASMLRWLLPYCLAMAPAACFKVVLDSHRRFTAPAVAGALVSGSVIAACFLSGNLGIASLIPGFLGGAVLAYVLQRHQSARIEPRIPISREESAAVKLPIADALIFGLHLCASYLFIVLDRRFASALPEGSIAALNYANAINLIPTAVVSTALATAIFPTLASLHATRGPAASFAVARKWAILAFVGGAIPALFLVVFRTEIVALLLARGRFDATAAATTSSVLSVLPWVIMVQGSSVIIDRLLLAQRRQVVFLGASAVGVALKAFLGALLVGPYGLPGLAWSTVLANSAATLLRYLIARRCARIPAGA